MNRILSHAVHAVLAIGFAVLCWVAAGYVGYNLLALSVSAVIAAFYLLGALELHRFRQATAGLVQAVSGLSEPPGSLATWLERLDPSLRNAVRLRIEGERVGLPGPALTPYLAGLLVLLGMTGTFLGMVVTLKGTGLALDSASDLESVRASLAAPVKGLGLAFGTSVAGVAASAMLGLASALCRRERIGAAQLLDGRIATSLRGFSLAHQREESLRLLQQQTRTMPALVEQLQAMLEALDRRATALDDGLQARQERFTVQAEARQERFLAQAVSHQEHFLAQAASHQEHFVAQAEARQERFLGHAEARQEQLLSQADVRQERFLSQAETRYTELAQSVGQSLEKNLDQSARIAAATIQPLAEATMAGIAREAASMHGRVAEAVERQLGDMAAHFEAALQARDEERLAAWTESLASLSRDNIEQTRDLLQAAAEAPRAAAGVIAELRQKLDQSVALDNRMLEERGRIFEMLGGLLQKLEDQTGKMGDVAAHVTGSAVEVASLGEAFGSAVQLFSRSNASLLEQLQRIEGTLARSISRSDEQLAYYVAQAREVIDLSIMSQKQIVDDLQQYAGRQLAESAA